MPAPHAVRTPSRKPSALVVSEIPVDRIIYSRMLEMAGLRAESSDFAAAPARCAERHPEIVLFDQSLADPVGLTDRIAMMPAGVRPKVVAILAPGEGAATRSDLCSATLNKPVTVDSLLPIIRELMDS